MVPWLPKTADCTGTENAAIFGCGLLSSYLGLFIEFFFRTYILKKVPTSKGKQAPAANGHAKHANGHGIANGKGIANGNGVA